MRTKLCRFTYEEVQDLLEKPSTMLVFLGVEKNRKPSSPTSVDEGVQKPAAWFAVGTDQDAAELLKRSREKNSLFPKIPNRDLLQLKEDEAGVNPNVSPFFGWSCPYFMSFLIFFGSPLRPPGVVAQARSVLAWHSRYSFCPTCGSSTKAEEGGYKRSCLNSDCKSLKGVHNTCYPRVGTRPLLTLMRRGKVCGGHFFCRQHSKKLPPESSECKVCFINNLSFASRPGGHHAGDPP